MTVVTDTSAILNLCWLGERELLVRLFSEVLAPPEAGFWVSEELDERIARITDE